MKRFLAVILGSVLLLQGICTASVTVYAEESAEEESVGEESADEGSGEENAEENISGESEEEGAQEENTAAVEISAPSAILMEASTGTVIYEKDADTARPPASVTKVMTLLLIFDALENGTISLEDEVTTSEYAASMGGSQVFLEAGEVQTVDTLIKCISVASANDACVAMAEYICGNEEEFVRRMNERAAELGMNHTSFVNALMSRELITKYPQIHDYCMIWMEDITHTTEKGTSEFGLTNTNKLVRQYEYATGLKTGSTGEAKFCVSATAEKNGVELIAVIMAAENSKDRFGDAVKLLNYGFGKCQIYTDNDMEAIPPVKVEGGVEEEVGAEYAEQFTWLDITGANLNQMEKTVEMKEGIRAPLKKGDVIGQAVYTLDGTEKGRVDIIASGDVEKAGFIDCLLEAAEGLRL